jgi:hypothetical protein
MDNLKPFIDAVNAAADEVQRIASEIYTFYEEGSVESKVKALDLRPALDQAEAEHEKQLALYESMQKAHRPNEIAKNFIPISTAQPDQTEGSQPTVIKRSAYNEMSLVQRAQFIKSNGTVED